MKKKKPTKQIIEKDKISKEALQKMVNDAGDKIIKFDHSAHWKGMPEFNQPGIIPVKVLLINFETKEDLLRFSKLVGQEITAKTKSIWYPIQPDEAVIDKRYTDKK